MGWSRPFTNNPTMDDMQKWPIIEWSSPIKGIKISDLVRFCSLGLSYLIHCLRIGDIYRLEWISIFWEKVALLLSPSLCQFSIMCIKDFSWFQEVPRREWRTGSLAVSWFSIFWMCFFMHLFLLVVDDYLPVDLSSCLHLVRIPYFLLLLVHTTP